MVAALHARLQFLAVGIELRELAVGRLDDQRGLAQRLAGGIGLRDGAGLEAFVARGNRRLLRRIFLVRHVEAVAELGRAYQRHADEMVDGPGAAQVRFAPGRLRRRVLGGGCDLLCDGEYQADSGQCQRVSAHLQPPRVFAIVQARMHSHISRALREQANASGAVHRCLHRRARAC